MRPFLVTLALALAGCSSCGREPVEQGENPSGETETETASGQLGTLRGRVILAEGTELPSYSSDDIQGDVILQAPEGCPPPRRGDRAPVSLAENGGLTGVMVYAEGERGAFFEQLGEVEPVVRELRIVNCRLEPQLVVAVRGDTLRMINESEHPFLPQFGRSHVMRALVSGQPQDKVLDEGGIHSVRCGYGASCGRSDVVVGHSPVFTISEDGTFEITNVPVGIPISVRAWHPLFLESPAVQAEIRPGGESEVEIVLTPVERPQEPAEAEGTEGPDAPEDPSAVLY